MAKQLDANQLYYQLYFRFPGRSQWMDRIWAEALADQYLPELEQYGYLTRHDLEVLTERLDLSPGSTLLDIGCGKGGPGLKIATQLNLKLTGLDPVPEAVEQAQNFQSQFQLTHPATFQVGEFYDLPLPDASMDAVISIDALWVVPNKITALEKVKRVLKPGAKFLFTFWDLLAVESVPLLEQSGLRFIHREDTPNWKEYQQRIYEGILKYEQELLEEMGEGATMLIHEAKTSPPYLDLSVRRVYEFQRQE